MQRSGLEWLWRVKEEPGLARRYLDDGLAFLRLIATQVIPLALWQRIGAAPESEFRRAKVRHPWGLDSSHVVLEGAWRLGNLDPVRREFTRLLARGHDVTLHMIGTSGIDSAFIGSLLLLDQALTGAGKRLRLEGLSPGLQRLLRLHGVAHLSVA
jgi:N-acetylglucosaminyldiphosphoundecaprenol N-acetyl-beta-D-mannosaminyltransferase